MKRWLALLALVVFLWPAAAQAAVALCAISGQVFNPDGSTLNNGTVQFNSQATQVVGSTTIPPSIISTTTDANGNMAPMSVAQGLFGTFTFCQGHGSTNTGGPGGGCSAAINGLIPINTTGNIQSVIAGTLLPSIGNATINNLTATANVNVGGTMQTQTLLVNGNSTLTGTLNVTGATTMSALLTAPKLSLTYNDCSALTLAQAAMSSNPPDGDLLVQAGSHCNPLPTGGYVADSNSAVMFANYTRSGTTGFHNAGWQWLGATGLTVGSTFTPNVLMTLGTDTADAAVGTPHSGTLITNTLYLTNNSTTALQFGGGSIASAGNPHVAMTAGAHYNGSQWIADATTNSGISLSQNPAPYLGVYMTTGATVGSTYTSTLVGAAGLNGWQFNGTNPVAILQSATNTNADILQVYPQNQTQGVGIGWSGLHSIGSNANVGMSIDTKGTGGLLLNTVNVGAPVYTTASLYIQGDYHINFSNNGMAAPGLTTCSAGSLYSLSTDNVGQVGFTGAGATSCAFNFGRAWNNYPLCTCNVMLSSSPIVLGMCAATTTPSSATFYFNGAVQNGSAYFDYHCMGTL